MHSYFCNCTVTGFAHSLEEKVVCFLPGLLRNHEVGSIEIDWVNAFGLYEFEDLHVVARGRSDALNLLVVDDDVLIFFGLIALDQLASLHNPLAMGAIGLLLDTSSAHAMNLMKANALPTSRCKQPNGNCYETESDIPLPDC